MFITIVKITVVVENYTGGWKGIERKKLTWSGFSLFSGDDYFA